ncbi:MAG TPA: helix-turn-helix domain-containing protein [Mucilaginibacter sp.]|nr:helix-turn-helix domain-containing protein [Mucilaginibacter sp.]
MQLPPSPAWSFCIKHYLFLRSNYGRALRIFSDGNTGMVFTLCGQLRIQKNDGPGTEVLPAAFVYGQLDRYHDISCDAGTEMLIIVFQPYGFFSLSGVPADELKGRIVDAELILGRTVASLTDVLRTSRSYAQSISVIENCFTGLLNGDRNTINPLRSVIKSIIEARGQSTVNELTRITGQSERQLERNFHKAIGTSPLKYLHIVRLHHFLSFIRSGNKEASLTLAGLESGYYDQPHLIHNFRQFTGLTPTQYLAIAGRLAVNLVIVN